MSFCFNPLLFILWLCCSFKLKSALIEPGFQKFTFQLSPDENKKNVSFSKSMFNQTDISFKIVCNDLSGNSGNFTLGMVIYMNKCHLPEINLDNKVVSENLPCHNYVSVPEKSLSKVVPLQSNQDDMSSEESNEISSNQSLAIRSLNVTKNRMGENKLPKTRQKGLYTVLLFFEGKDMTFEVTISAKHDGSYLSSMNWPLLPFYGVMSLVYLTFAIAWFIASCCNWRDLLRVQFWIGAVIGIGMLENALFYTEYRNISSYGETNGLLYFAEFVSCVKRTLARVLVIIVSLGFGIVKPRLGQMFHRVLAVGSLYLVLSTIEGCIRVRDDSKIVSKTQMYALIPLTILDVYICWWVFTSLVQTTRTLRIRKNLVKLTLYRHFTNTLIFAVLASLAYMIWMIKQSKLTECVDIGNIWLSEALWPFLFSVILAVIMILWRPNINNQRYAFTPLDLGGSDDEDDDMTLSDAFSGMKMRNKDNSGVKNRNRAEDDLKWVEENIPSVPSTLLPTIDSDEEILTTKFEMSKMN